MNCVTNERDLLRVPCIRGLLAIICVSSHFTPVSGRGAEMWDSVVFSGARSNSARMSSNRSDALTNVCRRRELVAMQCAQTQTLLQWRRRESCCPWLEQLGAWGHEVSAVRLALGLSENRCVGYNALKRSGLYGAIAMVFTLGDVPLARASSA